METKIKVLVGKVGLDGHDRGAKFIAKALMDSGMEVIYTGIRKTPKQIANIALQEDVNVVGLSILSGAHNTLFVETAKELKAVGKEDVLLIGGGVIPEDDISYLRENGFSAIYTPGTDSKLIIDYIKTNLKN